MAVGKHIFSLNSFVVTNLLPTLCLVWTRRGPFVELQRIHYDLKRLNWICKMLFFIIVNHGTQLLGRVNKLAQLFIYNKGIFNI